MPNDRLTYSNRCSNSKSKSYQSYEKKIEDEERREKYRKILEKRRAKASTEDPNDIPNNAETGNEAYENSKKE